MHGDKKLGKKLYREQAKCIFTYVKKKPKNLITFDGTSGKVCGIVLLKYLLYQNENKLLCISGAGI